MYVNLSFFFIVACNWGYYKDGVNCVKCSADDESMTTQDIGSTSQSECCKFMLSREHIS